MKREISVQLYSLRDRAEKDLAGVLRDLAEAGYKAVETAGLYGKSVAEFRKMLDDNGLAVSSAHTPLATKENVNEVVDAARTLGYKYCISGFGPDEFKTLDGIKIAAEKFQAAAELLKPHGLEMGYHNHWWEFALVNGRYGYNWFFELCPDVFSELDVYWCCNFNTVDVPAVVKAHRNNIKLLHIKDGPLVQDQPHTAVGAGKMNIPAVVKAAGKETQWLVVELDACATDMTQAVRESFAYLTKKRLGVARK
jgi:sugar phosphate isomerase/epimerase